MKKNKPQSEIRKHYFENRYVIISPKRALRPDMLKEAPMPPQPEGSDPFDPEPQKKEKALYEVREKGKWIIRVIENKFPALSTDNPKAYGKQELIIETPLHAKHLNDLSVDHIIKVLETYEQRIKTLSNMPKIKYVAVFKNEGGRAGASIQHAHSQVIALPFIPPLISSDASAMDEYVLKNGTCPYDDIIKKERKDKVRVIFDDGKIFALCPYSASAGYGVWIMPAHHKRTLSEITHEEKRSMARALKLVLSKLDEINLSYNFFLHGSLDLENHHFRMKIEPRLTTWGGLELGSGMAVNPVFPEDAAKFYRSKARK